jgi:hypothetical protein
VVPAAGSDRLELAHATSGGFIDHLVPQLEELRVDVAEGRIDVSTVPEERR